MALPGSLCTSVLSVPGLNQELTLCDWPTRPHARRRVSNFCWFLPSATSNVCSGNSFSSTPFASCFLALFLASLELIGRKQESQGLPLWQNILSTLNFAITLEQSALLLMVSVILSRKNVSGGVAKIERKHQAVNPSEDNVQSEEVFPPSALVSYPAATEAWWWSIPPIAEASSLSFFPPSRLLR